MHVGLASEEGRFETLRQGHGGGRLGRWQAGTRSHGEAVLSKSGRGGDYDCGGEYRKATEKGNGHRGEGGIDEGAELVFGVPSGG